PVMTELTSVLFHPTRALTCCSRSSTGCVGRTGPGALPRENILLSSALPGRLRPTPPSNKRTVMNSKRRRRQSLLVVRRGTLLSLSVIDSYSSFCAFPSELYCSPTLLTPLFPDSMMYSSLDGPIAMPVDELNLAVEAEPFW